MVASAGRGLRVAVEAGFGLSAVCRGQMNMEAPCQRLVQLSGEMKVD